MKREIVTRVTLPPRLMRTWQQVFAVLVLMALAVLSTHAQELSRIASSPRGNLLAAAGIPTNTIILFDIASGQVIRRMAAHSDRVYKMGPTPNDMRHFGGVFSLTFSADGQVLASAGQQTIELWESASGRLLNTLPSHADRIWKVCSKEPSEGNC